MKPKTIKVVYQLEDRSIDSIYLVRASSPSAAWDWMAENEGRSVGVLKRMYKLSEANVNEAR